MYIEIEEKKCIGCGDCLSICPVGAIQMQNDKATVNKKCVCCGACVSECSRQAICIKK